MLAPNLAFHLFRDPHSDRVILPCQQVCNSAHDADEFRGVVEDRTARVREVARLITRGNHAAYLRTREEVRREEEETQSQKQRAHAKRLTLFELLEKLKVKIDRDRPRTA